VIIGCFVVGMILTPPDIFSQTLLAVPMWLLFELGILAGSMVRKRSQDDDSEATEEPQDQPPAPLS
jgi:sec-independent protein translocase protein TatC